jgi:hypothetical protein
MTMLLAGSAPVHVPTDNSTPMCPRVWRRCELQALRQRLAIEIWEKQREIAVLDRVLETNEPRKLETREAHGGRVARVQGQRTTAEGG